MFWWNFQKAWHSQFCRHSTQTPCTCYGNHQFEIADFPYTSRGTEKLLVLHRHGNGKIRVLSNLFNIPSNRYGFHRQTSSWVQGASQSTHLLSLYWSFSVHRNKILKRKEYVILKMTINANDSGKNGIIWALKNITYLHFLEFSNFLLYPFWLLQRRFLSLLQFNHLQVTT